MSKLKELIAELCPNGVEYVKIGDICEVSRGRVMSKDYLKENVGEYSVYSSQTENDGELGKIATYDFDGEYLTWTTDGANAGTVFYRRGKFSVTNVCGLLKVKQKDIITKYLYYTLSVEAPKYVNKGMGNPKLMSNVMSKVKVKIPPIEIQQEIVRILDSFTSLTAELQAELQARQKQYEYYRDQLLTFDVHGGGTSEVQWKTIGEICRIYAGGDAPKSRMSKEKSEQYTVPIISNGVGKNAIYGYTDEAKVTETAVTVAARGTIGYAEYRDYPYYPIIRLITLIPIATDELNPKYLYYCLQGRQYSVPITGIPQLTAPMIRQVEIPIPKLEIQKKIVHVLDNFDAICSDLNIGLPAEIEARQKQYEYYRDALLSFNCSHSVNVERALNKLLQYVFGYTTLTIGEIGRISMCKRIMKAETSTHGDVPFFKIGTFGKQPDAYITQEKFDEYRKTYSFPKKGDVLISAAGTIGRTVIYNGEPAYYQDSNIVWVDNDESIVLNKYLYYFYQTSPWVASTGGTIARLYNDNISKTKIKVPTLEQQKKIVSILDRFETLCNDMTAGLPAEIEARQKQYEYYRDRLLSVPKLT